METAIGAATASIDRPEGGSEPWASVKGGRWHRTTTLAQNFRDKVRSLCGLSFQPFNVSEGFPSYSRRELWACAHCEAIDARTRPSAPVARGQDEA